jgi:DNA-directed RNA polymerase subunit RPC12/RpoP
MDYRLCPHCGAKIWEKDLVRCPDCDTRLPEVKK